MGKKNLSEMGVASVFLTEHMGVQCIKKQNTSLVELNFYQNIAPLLRTNGVNIPELIEIDFVKQNLFIEYIPNIVTLDELNANSETFSQLSKVHKFTQSINTLTKNHEWTELQTEKALMLLELPEISAQMLRDIQKQSDLLFDQITFISGDSNVGNWRVNSNGELVLFDWERFGYGSPAIDLAPLIKGMGAASDYEIVVNKYLKYNDHLSGSNLVKKLIIAKAWLIVEVTNLLKNEIILNCKCIWIGTVRTCQIGWKQLSWLFKHES